MFKNQPKIRTVSVPIKKETPKARPPLRNASSTPKLSTSEPRPVKKPEKRERPHTNVKANGYANSHSAPPTNKSAERQSLAVKHPNRKRKATTPTTPQWASSSSESESGEDGGFRKRQKTSSSLEPDSRKILDPDLTRGIRDVVENGGELYMIHGVDMTSGEHAKEFGPAFTGDEGKFVVELKYPSASPPERFEIVTARDPQGWDPIKDIEYTVEEMIINYFPGQQSVELQDETNGPVRLLKRAVTKDAPSDYRKALSDFNSLVRTSLADGTIPNILDSMHALPLSLVRRILAQVYQRTVSPKAHLLRKVKDKAQTYGELLPPFVHTIFHQTHLTSNSVFVDLGSGVGNVVLQAALQTGAESWGIEIMATPCEFATAQAKELEARARLWGLSMGPVKLLTGDFLESEEIDKVLRRADVVLVNNKVFPQELNRALLDKFLDLKEGAKVVSLESFTPGNRQGARNEQNPSSLFTEERFESGTASVSWAGESVDYYIATKDSSRLVRRPLR
ncbi:DOT1-domain-containing protein [Lepidopterella palustris CBS 459.81]|uniref:Histone-lysine N-methyltransferase, H3 lysine-79 specific n=1 Tax=Lepidopterella palustris CBS 459.81 TaxID=1314670 RepID=A0A8E2EBF9_9PEZI|nr:DOT1-domain-containing protein [Lepidopterella palustris CBS 459.81]